MGHLIEAGRNHKHRPEESTTEAVVEASQAAGCAREQLKIKGALLKDNRLVRDVCPWKEFEMPIHLPMSRNVERCYQTSIPQEGRTSNRKVVKFEKFDKIQDSKTNHAAKDRFERAQKEWL